MDPYIRMRIQTSHKLIEQARSDAEQDRHLRVAGSDPGPMSILQELLRLPAQWIRSPRQVPAKTQTDLTSNIEARRTHPKLSETHSPQAGR
jgi:hypothetical protein